MTHCRCGHTHPYHQLGRYVLYKYNSHPPSFFLFHQWVFWKVEWTNHEMLATLLGWLWEGNGHCYLQKSWMMRSSGKQYDPISRGFWVQHPPNFWFYRFNRQFLSFLTTYIIYLSRGRDLYHDASYQNLNSRNTEWSIPFGRLSPPQWYKTRTGRQYMDEVFES